MTFSKSTYKLFQFILLDLIRQVEVGGTFVSPIRVEIRARIWPHESPPMLFLGVKNRTTATPACSCLSRYYGDRARRQLYVVKEDLNGSNVHTFMPTVHKYSNICFIGLWFSVYPFKSIFGTLCHILC